MPKKSYPVTPDGRYFLAKDRLWRCSNPALSEPERRVLVKQLMRARLAVRQAQNDNDLKAARANVHAAKVALGERGPVWWSDGAEDMNQHHPKNTIYADWWRCLPKDGQ